MELLIAGPAGSLDLARATRIADLLKYSLPAITASVIFRVPEDYDRAEFVRSMGNPGTDADVLVWQGAARPIGSVEQFAELARAKYGIECDMAESELAALAAEQLKTAQDTKNQRQIAAKLRGKRALIIVDVQRDFCKGGSLAVPAGDAVIPVINQLRKDCDWDLVVLTQDFHPADHVSFARNHEGVVEYQKVMLPETGEQVMWPAHCVQGELGCEFHPYLNRADGDVVVQKGKNRLVDSYSGFGDAFEGKYEKTEMDTLLHKHEIQHVFVTGLALDFCVSFTAKDARKAGFDVFVVEDATRGIADATIAQETEAMKALGVKIIDSCSVPRREVLADVAAGRHK